MKYTISILLSAVLIGLSTNSIAATRLHMKDVVVHCGAELEAIKPGSIAKIKSMTDTEVAQFETADKQLELMNSPEMTVEILQSVLQTSDEDIMGPDYTSSALDLANGNYSTCVMKLRMDQLNGKTFSAEKSGTTDISSTSTNTNGSLDQAQTDEKDFDSCQPALDAQELEFKAINARNPNTKTVVMGTAIPSVVPGLQVTLYMTEKRMKLLNDYCKGQPQYSQYQSIKTSHDETMKVCLRSTSDNSVCKPNVPW